MKSTMKFWVSDDGQSEVGPWPPSTPDDEVLGELLDECGTDEDVAEIRAGKIETGLWNQ